MPGPGERPSLPLIGGTQGRSLDRAGFPPPHRTSARPVPRALLRKQTVDAAASVLERLAVTEELEALVGPGGERVELEGELLGIVGPGDLGLALELAQPGAHGVLDG